jgi:hypothetical protein
MRPSPRPVLLILLSLLPPPGPSFLLVLLLLASACVPIVPVRSLAVSARFAACVCFGVLLVAPLVVWPLVLFAGFALDCCCWSALPVLMLVWWALLAASLLR